MRVFRLVGCAVLSLATPLAAPLAAAAAQMPGVPVLQNAWANGGITVALDLASASGSSAYAAAAAWAPASARMQLSGGAGVQTRSVGSRAVYGLRAALPILGTAGAFGAGAFVGVGGAGGSDPGSVSSDVPIGVSLGYRRVVGANRGISVYAAPAYHLVRRRGTAGSDNAVGVAAGLDFAITPAIGATLGLQSGQSQKSAIGAAVSYALGRH